MELFAAHGYGGTSMADIAEGVGIRKASLYNYYDAKEELLLDLLRRALEAWIAHARPALEEPGTRKQRLRRCLEAAVAFVAESPHEVGIVRLAATQIGGTLGDRVKELLVQHDYEESARMERFFAGAMREGEIGAADTKAVTLSWKTFLDGLLINIILGPSDPNRVQERLPELWAFFWRGLGGRSMEAGEAGREVGS